MHAAQTKAPSTAAAPAQDARPRIVVLGDSLAEGLGVAREQSYPSLLQAKIDREGYPYRVVNMGVSGDTTSGGLSRLNGALSLKPSVLIIELGGNDGLRGVPAAITRANLKKMTIAAKRAGAEVLIAGMTLPPNYGPDYIRRFESAFHDIAREQRVQIVPSLFQPIIEQIGSRPGLMQPDGIHPAPEGHELLAEHVFRYLKPMLRKDAARS
ncbi:MAG TPA: arylesterase [Bryobacteraceae bacterium]|nr:arylesterase [Bryobacteraceae bacterium]